VYAARGVSCAADLELTLDRLLPVGSLEGVEAAARVLAEHRVSGRVLVIGDFDADGATSSALVVRALRAMQFAHVDFLVPNRFEFGYGLTPQIVALAQTRRPSLIVTVDNGISSIEGVEAARALGIPVLVTDHHLPGAVLPRASVIVNPNLVGSSFGSRALAGVGVAFYVMVALARKLNAGDAGGGGVRARSSGSRSSGAPGFRAADLLDLVALGTVADVVPLDRNNRILVEQGLRRIRAGRCAPGILALLNAAGRRHEQATAADLGFAVGPRLNAAGRLTDMSIGIACLLADDPAEAARLAMELNRLNEERREIEQRMQLEAVDIAADARVDAAGGESLGICLFDETWHQGVVGLVAGRIKDRVHRPVIAFARAENGALRGSARSVAGINIRDALDSIATRCPGLIGKFGGHAMAAGMTLLESDLPKFRAAFAAEVAARADAQTLLGVVHSDGELLPEELCLETARILRGGGPWGQGFAEPVFDGEFHVVEKRIVGAKHLKLRLEVGHRGAPAGSRTLDAIAFGYIGSAGEQPELEAGGQLHVAYRLELNEYRGAASMQLNCQHLRVV
jgi:single-stranded-DNA-specific exonuclease